jgi:hypothetical protein
VWCAALASGGALPSASGSPNSTRALRSAHSWPAQNSAPMSSASTSVWRLVSLGSELARLRAWATNRRIISGDPLRRAPDGGVGAGSLKEDVAWRLGSVSGTGVGSVGWHQQLGQQGPIPKVLRVGSTSRSLDIQRPWMALNCHSG